jgi:hypothetical protein
VNLWSLSFFLSYCVCVCVCVFFFWFFFLFSLTGGMELIKESVLLLPAASFVWPSLCFW